MRILSDKSKTSSTSSTRGGVWGGALEKGENLWPLPERQTSIGGTGGRRSAPKITIQRESYCESYFRAFSDAANSVVDRKMGLQKWLPAEIPEKVEK